MRADSRPAHQDFPWPTVIRTEMETWVPERLPATFQPRARRRPVSAGRQGRRPLAIGFAALIVASFVVGRLTAPPAVRTAAQIVATTAARLAPAPAATAVAATPARPAQPAQVVATRAPAAPAHVRSATPAPSPSTPAPATPQPSPGATATPVSSASPASTPQPSPSPSMLCLPLNLLCV